MEFPKFEAIIDSQNEMNSNLDKGTKVTGYLCCIEEWSDKTDNIEKIICLTDEIPNLDGSNGIYPVIPSTIKLVLPVNKSITVNE